MKWMTINKTHVNMDKVDAFKWEDGALVVFFNADENPAKWHDPDRKLYRQLCGRVCVCPYVEDEVDG